MLFLFAAATIASLALAGNLYVLFFAIVGLFSRTKSVLVRRTPCTRFAVLIPAHNEEEGIHSTLRSVLTQAYPQTLLQVLVIADNCTDRTAEIVRQQGLDCWERTDPDRPGKGRAIRWALDGLRGTAFDAVVLVDADTRLSSEFLLEMDQALQSGVKAAQSRNEFELVDSSYFTLLSYASKRAESDLFWAPRNRLGLYGFLSGNGFCLKREVLDALPWSAYSIVEDLEYTLRLIERGIRVEFVENARVSSRPTRRVGDAYLQRLRWASGTLQIIAKSVPRILRASFTRRSLSLLEASLAVVLTSRFLLFYLVFASAICFALEGSLRLGFLGWMLITNVLLLGAYVGIVLTRVPKGPGWRWQAVLKLPFYVSWMFIVHLAAIIGLKRRAWARSAR